MKKLVTTVQITLAVVHDEDFAPTDVARVVADIAATRSAPSSARPHLTKIEGLWGTGIKGTRGGEKKPGSWRVFLAEHAPKVLPENAPVEETS